MIVEEDGRTKRVVFSGDLGPRSAPMLREFEPFQQADLLFLESTYGGRDHRSFKDTVAEFERIVIDAVKSGGKMLVPTFAIGRAQLITLLLGKMFRAGKVKSFPIFLDSPMAIEATNIYVKHMELFDDEMKAFIRDRPLRADLKTMKPTATADESRAINDVRGACLVMAGAGMCNGGRIVHHLRANLWKPSTHVLIVGYQGHGSLGRRLVDGEKEINIFGEKVAVKATIHTLGGFSAHAGQTDLMHWFDVIARSKPRVILTHGEDDQRAALARLIQRRHRLPSKLPKMSEVIEI
jgi:metallo-beta-lactamase family protein